MRQSREARGVIGCSGGEGVLGKSLGGHALDPLALPDPGRHLVSPITCDPTSLPRQHADTGYLAVALSVDFVSKKVKRRYCRPIVLRGECAPLWLSYSLSSIGTATYTPPLRRLLGLVSSLRHPLSKYVLRLNRAQSPCRQSYYHVQGVFDARSCCICPFLAAYFFLGSDTCLFRYPS